MSGFIGPRFTSAPEGRTVRPPLGPRRSRDSRSPRSETAWAEVRSRSSKIAKSPLAIRGRESRRRGADSRCGSLLAQQYQSTRCVYRQKGGCPFESAQLQATGRSMSLRRGPFDGTPTGQHQRELGSAGTSRTPAGANGTEPLRAPGTSRPRRGRTASNQPPAAASPEEALARSVLPSTEEGTGATPLMHRSAQLLPQRE